MRAVNDNLAAPLLFFGGKRSRARSSGFNRSQSVISKEPPM